MCSANDDPTTYDAPAPQRPRRYVLSDGTPPTHGRLGLSTPWARQGIDRDGIAAIESLIPVGTMVGVAAQANRAKWILWRVVDGEMVGDKLYVSRSMTLRRALEWALIDFWRIAR